MPPVLLQKDVDAMSGNGLTSLEFLGREIRTAREAKGLSRAKLAKELTLSESTVAGWETGKNPPRREYLEKVVEVLEFVGSDIVMRILEHLVGGEVSPEWTGKWLAIEKRADTLLSFEHSVVPGMLQTQDYARNVLEYDQNSPIGVDERLNSRLERQRDILERDNPPMLVSLINEVALQTPVGETQVMHGQCLHLQEMAQKPNVYVQIVPGAIGYHLGFDGAFMIGKFDGNEVAYQPGPLYGTVIEDPAQVAKLYRIWQHVQARALTQSDSYELLGRMAEKWT